MALALFFGESLEFLFQFTAIVGNGSCFLPAPGID